MKITEPIPLPKFCKKTLALSSWIFDVGWRLELEVGFQKEFPPIVK
jgi:hypothetical protein